MTDYVVYYRVSTQRQGRSGLGLESQRSMVNSFLKEDDKVIGEFTEIKSGKINSRSEVWKCINLVKKTGSKLLVPRLDRFSRKVSFVSKLIDQGIEIVVCTSPNITTFHLHLLSCFCEEEGRLISERTKLSLLESKKRGTKLGTYGKVLSKINKGKKKDFIKSIRPHLTKVRNECKSLNQMSIRLNEKLCQVSEIILEHVGCAGCWRRP